MTSPSRPKRPHAAPHLLAHLRASSSSASLSSASLSADLDALPHAPSPVLRATKAAQRSPSALSLASSAHSAPGGGARRSRTPSAATAQSRSTGPADETSSVQAGPTRTGAQDDGQSDDGARSRSSSSSSLEGLAARLQGAREGKGKTRAVEPGALGGMEGAVAGSPSSARKGKGRAVESSGGRAADATADDTVTVDAVAADAPSPTDSSDLRRRRRELSSASSSPSTRYDLPSLSPAAASSFSPAELEEVAFQRAPSPSSSVADDDDEPSSPSSAASLVSLSRADAHTDPRSLLRAQLARAPSKRGGEEVPHVQRGKEKDVFEAERRVVRIGELIRRRYFILSTAGKLVYTSDDDEEAATGLVGVMQAIVSIFADEGDKLRYIDAGSTRISFLLKAPLYLVVVSSLGEPESVLRMHLDYLYLQVLSVVTLAQLQAIFARRSNFDLRRLMEGTEPFFHSLTATLQTSLPILLSSIEVYRVSPSVRAELSLALDPGKEAVRALDLLYVLLLSNGRLVTLLRPKKHSIHPTDLHLLLSTIYAPRATPSGTRPSPLTQPGAETWLPVCLPRFNPRGFLHAYVAFPDGAAAAAAASGDGSGSGTGLVLLSSQRDALPGVRAAASSILARLAAGDALHALAMARAQQAYSLGEVAVPGVRHFVYKDRGLVQVTRAGWEGEYAEDGGEEGERARMRLLTLYQHLHDALHPRPAAAGTAYRPPTQVQYLRTEHEAVLGWVTPQFELYLATSPLLPHSAVVSAARAVSRWVKKEERGLFLHGAGTF